MQNYDQEAKTETQILDRDLTMIIIPECCREGWDTCPHKTQRPKPAKKNIGL